MRDVFLTVKLNAKYIPILLGYLKSQSLPDNDGLSEVRLMEEYELSVDEFVEAQKEIDKIYKELSNLEDFLLLTGDKSLSPKWMRKRIKKKGLSVPWTK